METNPTENAGIKSPSIPPHRGKGGVFITKGAIVAIPAGGLRISFGDGKLDGSLTLHVGLNLTPVWAEIGLRHVSHARQCRERVVAAWRGTDDNLLADELIQEFTASMEAIVAAGILIDSLYAAVKDRAGVPETLVEMWQRNRTARYKQVGEVLRQAFRIKPRNAVAIRSAIKDIYKFRDWAVHPPAEARAPAHHGDLLLNTEWRFVAFSYKNAYELVRASLAISWQVANKTDLTGALADWCKGLKSLLEPVVQQWEAEFGPLTASNNEKVAGAA